MEDSACKFSFCLARNGAAGASCYVISTCLTDMRSGLRGTHAAETGMPCIMG